MLNSVRRQPRQGVKISHGRRGFAGNLATPVALWFGGMREYSGLFHHRVRSHLTGRQPY